MLDPEELTFVQWFWIVFAIVLVICWFCCWVDVNYQFTNMQSG